MKKYLLIGLILSLTLLLGVGVVNANGHHGHHGHDGQFEHCDDECVYPTATPTIDPCQVSEVAKYGDQADPCVTPSPEVTPTDAPPAAPGGDGLSDGRSSCPDCTKAPVHDVHGQVLSSQTGWK